MIDDGGPTPTLTWLTTPVTENQAWVSQPFHRWSVAKLKKKKIAMVSRQSRIGEG